MLERLGSLRVPAVPRRDDACAEAHVFHARDGGDAQAEVETE
jgi:hypothetical protein